MNGCVAWERLSPTHFVSVGGKETPPSQEGKVWEEHCWPLSTPITHLLLPREGNMIWIQLVNLGEETKPEPEFVMSCRASEEPIWDLRDKGVTCLGLFCVWWR